MQEHSFLRFQIVGRFIAVHMELPRQHIHKRFGQGSEAAGQIGQAHERRQKFIRLRFCKPGIYQQGGNARHGWSQNFIQRIRNRFQAIVQSQIWGKQFRKGRVAKAPRHSSRPPCRRN